MDGGSSRLPRTCRPEAFPPGRPRDCTSTERRLREPAHPATSRNLLIRRPTGTAQPTLGPAVPQSRSPDPDLGPSSAPYGYRAPARRRTPYASTPTASTPVPTTTEVPGSANARTVQPRSPTAGSTRLAGAESSVQADALATA